jgi:hypothetical protein
MRSVGFLAHDQDPRPGIRPAGGYLRKEDAEMLVAQLAVERISQKLIRALPPNSSFCRSIPLSRCVSRKKLNSGNVDNLRFCPPQDPAWQETHGPATHSLRTRGWMALKAWKAAS